MFPTPLGGSAAGGVYPWQSTQVPLMWTSSTAASTTESAPPSVAVNRRRMSSLGASTDIRSALNVAHPLVGLTRCSSSVQAAPPLFDTSALYESLLELSS